MTASAVTNNLLGALIFWSYIVAALVFTGIICFDLATLYARAFNSDKTKQQSLQSSEKQYKNAQLFLGWSFLSFAVLSYHMLNFLIHSYSAWSVLQQVVLPTSFFGNQGIFDLKHKTLGIQPWRWSTASTLFQDFATVICDDPRRFWWTQQALLYSFGWNIYMSIQGVRHKIPHLWAYFVLDQILPISFTQNLFCTALLLGESRTQDQDLNPAPTFYQYSLVCAYLTSVWMAPRLVNTPWFFPMLFTTRALLFAPFALLAPKQGLVGRPSSKPTLRSYFLPKHLLIISDLFLCLFQTWRAIPLIDTLHSIQDSPAVSALGYDYLLALASLVCFGFVSES